MSILNDIVKLGCYGVYFSCLAWGIGLPLLPYAIGAHIGVKTGDLFFGKS